MPLELQTCPHCSTRVVAKSDGTCPSCRQDMKGEARARVSPAYVAFRRAPTSVTVVAWILIVIAGVSMIALPINSLDPAGAKKAQDLMSRSPIPIPVQVAMAYAGMLVWLICGVAMLRGQNWARLLFVFWTALASAIGIATSPTPMLAIPGIVFFIACTALLFRPPANAFFSAASAQKA